MSSVSQQQRMHVTLNLLNQPPRPIHSVIAASTVSNGQKNHNLPDCPSTQSDSKYSKMQESLESSLCTEGKVRVTRLLSEINHLSDLEKFLLYLNLPTGEAKEDTNRLTPPSCLPISTRKEQGEALTWIKSHFEEHGDVCTPKAEVYDEYKQYCEQHELRPLCNADFGKVMKQVFPDINTRRLGQRGQSKYFYGGLGKKTDFTPPVLSDLEVKPKNVQVNTVALENEILKASCELVCEWANKLFDSKFTGVENVAEHLLGNMYVNTRSKAAFTLIAALQDNGKNDLKRSALFTSQAASGGDKHKETNLLLKQKLHKNSQLQKQREKLQAMKSELEQSGNHDNTTDPKAQHTTSRKSMTPSQTPNLPSPSSSPNPDPSPRKPLSSWQLESKNSKGQGHQGHNSQGHNSRPPLENTVKGALNNKLKSMKAVQAKKDNLTDKLRENSGNSAVAMETNKTIKEQKSTKNSYKKDNSRVLNISEQKLSGLKVDKVKITNEIEEMEVESNKDCRIGGAQPERKEIDLTGAHTPGNEMEMDETIKTHVRKINFDVVKQKQEVVSTATMKMGINSNSSQSNLSVNTTDVSTDVLSKSTGFINFQQLLKNPNDAQLSLNKSMGFLEKSKTTVRSAFVPVQSVNRKDGGSNQSVAMAIPVIIPSAVTSQSAACVLPATSFLPTSSNTEAAVIGEQSIVQNPAKESINVVTVTSVLSKMPSSDIIVSSTGHSQAFTRNTRSKFTPIRPKASPTKTPKDGKTDLSQCYDKDKRPVAAILKEKRAKEQAEAMAKQAGLTLQRIQIPTNMNLSANQIQALPSASGSSSLPSEVVIIVNNQPFVDQSGTGTPVSQATLTGTSVQTSVTSGIDRIGEVEPNSDIKMSEGNTDGGSAESGKLKTVTFLTEDSNSLEIQGDYSPMEGSAGDVTPILEERDSTPEMELSNESTERRTLRYPVQDLEEDLSEKEKANSLWIETPSKIAKLNINSPFRPESACSLGRETPVKITKSESSQSRPESACSYGRETPSGARKRKSSESQARQNFKRLNSTGEESEDGLNLSLVLSPESDSNMNVRRTRSCTYELEKGCHVKSQQNQKSHHQQQQQQHHQQQQTPQLKSGISLQGLQSPDINCLEREALIESFPHSLLAMKPGQSSRTQSVSVGVRSLRHSQQKLMSQQQDLDQRVKNFFQTKAETSTGPVKETKTFPNVSTNKPVPSGRSSATSLVVSDRGKPYVRPASVVTVSHSNTVEPSGLPSDVADWINEALEKRQKENQSEPNLHRDQSSRISESQSVENFVFEIDNSLFGSGDKNGQQKCSQIPQEIKQPLSKVNKDENMFTVPKAPPIASQRGKDHSMRLHADQVPNNQRCQSLPIFASPAQSPVSPVTSPISGCHSYQRALSMSPRGQPMEVTQEMMSPVSNQSPGNGMMSPSQRKEPADGFQSPGQPIGQLFQGRDGSMNKVGPYLKRIQQSLQKPAAQLPRQTPPMSRTITPDKHHMTLALGSGNLGQGHFQGQGLMLSSGPIPQLQSRESSLDVEERYISQTPFSDSGYQSSGPSPILNSTPVSTIDGHNSGNMIIKHSVAESPVTMVADFTSPIPNLSTHIKSPRQQLISQQVLGTMTTIQLANQNPGVLRSSIHSAFIPIQGSHDIRYVTPIKPTVTLPNTVNPQGQTEGNSTNLFIDTGEQITSSDITIVSPRSADPPSYEMAIKQLHRAGQMTDSALIQSSTNPIADIDSINTMNKSEMFPSPLLRDSRLAMEQSDALGPFAAKLKLLSQQTQSVDMDTNDLLLNLLSPTSDTVAITTTALTNIPANELPVSINSSQSVTLNQNDAGNLNSSNEKRFSLQSMSNSDNILLYNACLNSNQRLNSQSVLDIKSAKNIQQTSYPVGNPLGNPQTNSVLNIDPSFNLSPSANQNSENSVMSSFESLNDNLLMVEGPDENQMSLTENADILADDISLVLDSLDGQYFNETDDTFGQYDILDM